MPPVPFQKPSITTSARGWLKCGSNVPPDAPRVCVGSLTVAARGVTLRRGFRIRSEYEKTGTTGFLDLRAGGRKLRRLVGKVKVTVHSKVRNGQTKSASTVFSGVELE